MSNTNAILSDCPTAPTAPTAPAALAARSNGPEWFLPSAKELNEMYVNEATLEAVSGFAPFGFSYWSSTEWDSNDVWLQYFFYGNQIFNDKSITSSVRAVRAF